jgi:AcrR family transcriptional regulator
MPSAGKRARSRFSGPERKAHIVAAATALFAAKGFAGATTREIAQSLGISETLIYKHFPTKRALYAAILAQQSPLPGLRPVLEQATRGRDDRRVFSCIANMVIRDVPSTLPRLLLFSALEGHALSSMFFQHQVRGFYDFLSGYIRKRIREGAFKKVDPLLAARAFMGMAVYHRLLSQIFKLPVPHKPEAVVETFVAWFLTVLKRS